MSCYDKNLKRLQDKKHMLILAKQYAHTMNCDVALVQEENHYNFFELSYAENKKLRILEVVRVSTSKEILQDSDDRGVEVSVEDEGGEDTRDERIVIADVDNGISEFSVGLDDIGAFEFDEGQELLG